MRALVLISGLATGGAERVTVSFLRRLVATGHQASACTVTDRHDGPLALELASSGIRRHDLRAARLSDPRALVRLIRLVKREQPDIIHAHGQDASILAAAVRGVSHSPLIITRHVLDEPRNSWRQACRAQIALIAMHKADSVVAVSAAAAARLVELNKSTWREIRVIPNGIELQPFRAADLPVRSSELRRRLGFELQDRVVLLPAALREGKGHDVLLAALPLLQRRIPELRVAFAGSGDREVILRENSRPFGNAVRFLGDFTDMPALYHASDLIVLPSHSEALPTALIEAAAAARPVVATQVGGTAEVVSRNRTGMLVPPNDPRELATAIVEMLNSPERLKAYGHAARVHAERNFSIDLHVERTLKLWSEVMERRVG
jgi:glycosyltransferase involved in cell wall biosynthesis